MSISQNNLSSTINNALRVSAASISSGEKNDTFEVTVQRGFDIQIDSFKNKYADKENRCVGVPLSTESIYYLSNDSKKVNVVTDAVIVNHYTKTITENGKSSTFGIITYYRDPKEIVSCSTNVKEIVLPRSLSTIKAKAFNNCVYLSHVQFCDVGYYSS